MEGILSFPHSAWSCLYAYMWLSMCTVYGAALCDGGGGGGGGAGNFPLPLLQRLQAGSFGSDRAVGPVRLSSPLQLGAGGADQSQLQGDCCASVFCSIHTFIVFTGIPCRCEIFCNPHIDQFIKKCSILSIACRLDEDNQAPALKGSRLMLQNTWNYWFFSADESIRSLLCSISFACKSFTQIDTSAGLDVLTL